MRASGQGACASLFSFEGILGLSVAPEGGHGVGRHSVASTLPLVRSAKSCRLSEPTGKEEQGQHRDDRRRRRSQVRCTEGNDPERFPRQDDDSDEPIQQRPPHHAHRSPRTEIDERDSDEPLALSQVHLEDAAVHEKARAGETCEGASQHHGRPPNASDAHPKAVGRGRVLSHRLDLQPVGRAVEDEGHDGNQEEGQVDEHALLEEHPADHRDLVEQWNTERRQRGDRKRRADQLLEQQGAEAKAEEVDTDPADALFRLERHADEGCDHAHDRARACARQDGEEKIARLQRGVVRGERGQEHDPVDSEVDDPASLADSFAECGKEKRSCERDARRDGDREDVNCEELVHRSPPPLTANGGSWWGRRGGLAARGPARAIDWARARLRRYSSDTTRTTTIPLSAVTRSEGTPVATCSDEPPTIRPPKKNAEKIVHSGLRPPKSATTMPLQQAEPVNPVRLPSVTMRCEMLPNTRIAPARPHMAPLKVIARVIVRLTGMPA